MMLSIADFAAWGIRIMVVLMVSYALGRAGIDGLRRWRIGGPLPDETLGKAHHEMLRTFEAKHFGQGATDK